MEKLNEERNGVGMKWISVKDRLPKNFIAVLVWPRLNHEAHFWPTAWRDKEKFYQHDNDYNEIEKEVSHWMPLPKPPEETL